MTCLHFSNNKLENEGNNSLSEQNLLFKVRSIKIIKKQSYLILDFFFFNYIVLISKSLARNRIRTAYASDKRIQIMDEIICGIHIIKMYAWEKPYEHVIQKLRK